MQIRLSWKRPWLLICSLEINYSNSLRAQIHEINFCAGKTRAETDDAWGNATFPIQYASPPLPLRLLPHHSLHLSSLSKPGAAPTRSSAQLSSRLHPSSLYLFRAMNQADGILQQEEKSIKVISFWFCFSFVRPLHQLPPLCAVVVSK